MENQERHEQHSFIGQPGASALDELFWPITTLDFLQRYRGTGHFFLIRDRTDYYESIFALDDLDRCLAVANGNKKTLITLVAAAGSGRKTVEGPVTESMHDLAYKQFAQGDTIRLIGIENLSPTVRELALRINGEIGVKAHVNAYLTPASSQGFSVHFDYHDVFILQISGSKVWSIYDPIHRDPVDLDFAKVWNATPESEAGLVLREERILKAGDLLYIPRGFYHKAKTSNAHSLHLTVSLNPLYWVSVIQKAIELLCTELPELREALPPKFLTETAIQERMRDRFFEIFSLVAANAPWDETVRALLRKEFSVNHHPADGHFRDLVLMDQVRAETVVQKRSGMVCFVATNNGYSLIQFGANHVQGPPAIGSALEFIRDNNLFKAGDMPGPLSSDGKIVLIRRLIQEGLLRLARL